MKLRVVLAVISSLLDEALILFLIIWVLPKLGINIPLPWLVAIFFGFAGFSILTFRIGTRALCRRPLAGLTDMTGLEGVAVKDLAPRGLMKVMGELWEARAEDTPIPAGTRVCITGRRGLLLIVRRQRPTREG